MAIEEILAAWNPWWQQPRVPPVLAGRPRRLTPRIVADLEHPEAVVLAGIRRGGKTTLLYQVVETLLSRGVDPRAILYVNLEDVALDGVGLPDIDQAHRRIHASDGPRYLLLDEVQTRPDWYRFVRVLVDRQTDRVAVTGSTSALLRSEAGRVLTGRHRTTEVRPLDFQEALAFHDKPRPRPPLSPEARSDMVRRLDRYLETGGFPRANLDDPADARRLLQHYLVDIVQRDLVASQNLDPVKGRTVATYLVRTSAQPHTVTSIHRATGLARETVRHYLGAFQAAYILQECRRFTFSPKPEDPYPFKVYTTDPGLRHAVSATPDRGRLAETVVANTLHAAGNAVYYWKDARHEVDFVTPGPKGTLTAWQVTYGDDVPKRETAAAHAFEEASTRPVAVTLLTRHQKGKIDGVAAIPLWEWLMGPDARHPIESGSAERA